MTEIFVDCNDSQRVCVGTRPMEQTPVTAPCFRIGAITDAEHAGIRQRSSVCSPPGRPILRAILNDQR